MPSVAVADSSVCGTQRRLMAMCREFVCAFITFRISLSFYSLLSSFSFLHVFVYLPSSLYFARHILFSSASGRWRVHAFFATLPLAVSMNLFSCRNLFCASQFPWTLIYCTQLTNSMKWNESFCKKSFKSIFRLMWTINFNILLWLIKYAIRYCL